MKLDIVTEDQSPLGELVITTKDPGIPIFPSFIPHIVDNGTLFSHPHWCPTNATTTPALTRLWVASHIASWLMRCRTKHGDFCNRNFGSDLPTRLLHIQEDGSLKLVHTQDLEVAEAASISYASVSHVWGTAEMFKLTAENIERLQQTIPLDALYRKFRETIDVAAAVGIRYIWIDTLCIIQGSEADWKREAGRMAAVYQNATLNFAAVGGSATDVCLTSRNRRPPVLKRGWIWQERFLSRRTVYLGDTQLAWECGRCLWLESTGFANRFDDLAIWTGDEGDLKRWKSHWDNFTAAYTDAGLTRTTDKLAAVAGIAKAFQQESLHTYVAGMWKEHIKIGGLLWRTNSRLPRPAAFRGAPSWSWASVDGSLSY
ncbi:heterokaryon incompatibility protein-domain-containing protein, partial [Lasiosphaeris hirsuta]